MTDPSRLERTTYGTGSPEVSVLVIRYHEPRHPDWWTQCRGSVERQRGLTAWELVSILPGDDPPSIGACRNVLVDQADAPWLYFLDDDDWLHPDALHVLRSHADGADIVRHEAVMVDADGGMGYGCTLGPLGLIRTSTFDVVGPFADVNLDEDTDWLRRADESPSVTIELLTVAPYYHRFHASSANQERMEDAGFHDYIRTKGGPIDHAQTPE